ncbi:peptidylprolyl isomerase [Olivibacter sp. SDN3]|uniref:peptidylprolyl isomerase n=1 Tax=Olivibacter sp. SDN3 TaxID=2764720 RepID=UPI00165127EC|nr:peptidylprolyl isomerase [Olivibacter sp. SDN3]QNL51202.1 peptidylprolyl isomerase [Olivibacter sp. SDN3]
MKKIILFTALLLISLVIYAAKPKQHYIRLLVNGNECIIRLYEETPKHRDNFLNLVKEGFYNGTLFHRVIKDFMIQGGDPESKDAAPGVLLGEGDLDYRIPAEFNDSLFHKKGVLAAARDNNLEKESSATQFYLVQGKRYTSKDLDRMETLKMDGRKFPQYQREIYQTLGGTPFLDQNYTVFGETVKGLELIDSIASLPTDSNDRPLQNQKMEFSLLKPIEVRKLEAELRGEDYKPNIFRRFLDLFVQ